MKQIRLAMIGCGGYAGAHARRLLSRDDVRIVALASRTEQSISKLSKKRLSEYTPAPARYTSLSELYANEELDAVVLSTPHNLHVEQAMQAIDAGCHVLIEKPMADSLETAQRLVNHVRTVRAAHPDLTVGVCYNPAYSRAMETVRGAVASGSHGRLELVTGYLTQDWKRLTAGSWRQDSVQSGGGQAMDSGAHLVHSLISGVGAAPEELFAWSDSSGAPVDINTVVSVRFSNGVLANLTIGGNSPSADTATSFIFDGGRIDVDAWRGEWVRSYRPEQEPEILEDLGEPSPDDAFIDAVLGKGQFLADEQDGLLVAAFTDALYRSVATGKPVRIELAEQA